MAMQVVQSVSGRSPVVTDVLSKDEMSDAEPFLRGVWFIPGKGYFHILGEDGKASRLSIKSVSVYTEAWDDGSNGSLCYETSDHVWKSSSDVAWIVRGKHLFFRTKRWLAHSPTDQERIVEAASEAGLKVLLGGNLTKFLLNFGIIHGQVL